MISTVGVSTLFMAVLDHEWEIVLLIVIVGQYHHIIFLFLFICFSIYLFIYLFEVAGENYRSSYTYDEVQNLKLL